jgi:hypothetical protein
MPPKSVPQWLKPRRVEGIGGTAEPVPFARKPATVAFAEKEIQQLARLQATHPYAHTGPPIVRPLQHQGPAVGKKLNSGTVVCCADAIPGMREEIVLGAVIELVTRTQLATDVETQSGNSDSN